MGVVEIIYLILAVTAIFDLVFPYLISYAYSDYDHKTMPLSMLGTKKNPKRWEYNIWTAVSGAVFMVSGYAFMESYRETFWLSLVLAVLLILYGAGCELVSAFFPTVDKGARVTKASQVHGVASAVGMTALLFAPLLLSIIQFLNGQTALGVVSAVFFAAGLIFFLFFILGEKPGFENTFLTKTGLWQRLSMLALYIPIIVTAVYYIVQEIAFDFIVG